MKAYDLGHYKAPLMVGLSTLGAVIVACVDVTSTDNAHFYGPQATCVIWDDKEAPSAAECLRSSCLVLSCNLMSISDPQDASAIIYVAAVGKPSHFWNQRKGGKLYKGGQLCAGGAAGKTWLV